MVEPLVRVGDIAESLSKAFPLQHAAQWDKNGLRVGDRNAKVKGVVFALEPTLEVLELTAARGANVLVTHHPIYLDAPEKLETSTSHLARMLQFAFKHDIALINAHTNLDAAEAAKSYIGQKLGLIDSGDLPTLDESGNPSPDDEQPTFARLWSAPLVLSLAEITAKLESLCGSPLVVWGDPHTKVETVVTAAGSGSSRIPEALAVKADLLITGEVGYHSAGPAVEMGLVIIELGHDVSEWPHVSLLHKAVMNSTVIPLERLFEAPTSRHWRIKEGK